ncbi:hypothetical protein Agabi119p4_1455 [Agaricus bisporus var. burnettii]|uniref:Uncharacterized protein n=1 Tax=Agaricus bisporus var. burnettii TaxID=192524 RepID=A0A8H7F9U3_AGABI|nr:hypothetical protein Agabi119p4_1455 [Agaricus bisporus var. burnettii]
MSDPFSIVKSSSSRDLLFNRIWLQGMVLRGVFYGIVFTLCCSCIHLLVSRQAKSSTPPRKRWLLAYVSFLLLLSTIVMVLGGIQNEEAYIFHSDYPGGPATFTLGDSSAIPIAQSICFILLQWATDGLLIWRCFTFFAVMSSYKSIIQVFLGIIVVLDIGKPNLYKILEHSSKAGLSGRPERHLPYSWASIKELLAYTRLEDLMMLQFLSRKYLLQLFEPYGRANAYSTPVRVLVA